MDVCVWHRLDLCGQELLFVSAASLMLYLHFACISLLHIVVLSRVAYCRTCSFFRPVMSQQKELTILAHYNNAALQGRAQSLIEILIWITGRDLNEAQCLQMLKAFLIAPPCEFMMFY